MSFFFSVREVTGGGADLPRREASLTEDAMISSRFVCRSTTAAMSGYCPSLSGTAMRFHSRYNLRIDYGSPLGTAAML
jgi:hypothetical protein